MKDNVISSVFCSEKNVNASFENSHDMSRFDENIELNLTSDHISLQKMIDDLENKNVKSDKRLDKSFFQAPKEKILTSEKKDYLSKLTKDDNRLRMEIKHKWKYRDLKSYELSQDYQLSQDTLLKKKHFIENIQKQEVSKIKKVTSNSNQMHKDIKHTFKIDTFNINILNALEKNEKTEVPLILDKDYFYEKVNLHIDTFLGKINELLEKSLNLPKKVIKICIDKMKTLKSLCKKHYKDESLFNCFLKLIKKMFNTLLIMEEWHETSLQKELLEYIKKFIGVIIENQDKIKIKINIIPDLMNYLYLALKSKILGFDENVLIKLKKYKKNDMLDFFTVKKTFPDFEDIVNVMREYYELSFNFNRFCLKLKEALEEKKKNIIEEKGTLKKKNSFEEITKIISKNFPFLDLVDFYYLMKYFIEIYSININ